MPAIKSFNDYARGPEGVALSLVSITPSDANDLVNIVRAIYVGTPGDVCVIDSAGNTVTFKNVYDGQSISGFAVARVKATGTTATNLVGFV